MMANLWGGMEGLFRRRGTGVEVQKLLDDLDLKNQELEYELLGMRKKADDLNRKEVEITNMEEKLRNKEQILERQSEKVKEKDKAAEAKLKLLFVKQEYIKVERTNLDLEKQEISSEKEKLVVLKDELERKKDEINQKQLQIHDENKRLQIKTELLLKVQENVNKGRKKFEVERQALDEKKVDVSSKIQQLMEEKQMLEKLRNIKDQLLRKGKIANEDYIREKERDRTLVNISNRMEEIEKKIQYISSEKQNTALSPKTTNLLPELSRVDRQAARKRTKAEETPIITEAEGRKRRQTVAADFESTNLNKEITDESPGEDEPGMCLLGEDGNDNKLKEEEDEVEEDEDSHLGETSVARKIWKFFIT